MHRLPALARQVVATTGRNLNVNYSFAAPATISSVSQYRHYAKDAAAAKQALSRRLVPLLDRVVVEKSEAVTKTKGGIVIPEKAQGKVLQGTIVAVGPGARNEKGDNVPLSVVVGETVLLPEYGGTKVEIDDAELYIYREHDIIAKLKD